MDALFWIILFGFLMSAIALIGGVALVLRESTLERLLLPMVALSAGSLFGGAVFHMLPEASAKMNGDFSLYIWFAGGFVSFLLLEQFLGWHHCHRTPSRHTHPLTYLLLVADGIHNFIGGLAVGAAFVSSFSLGLTMWLVAAVHEVPQELGDFGVLVHHGWSKGKALLYNFLSGLTFLIGGITAFAVSGELNINVLIPFAAGNFIYIGAVDLIPEIKPTSNGRSIALPTVCFLAGLGVLLLIRYAHLGD